MTVDHSVGEALYRNIIQDPQDRAARLIYADWLDENGLGETEIVWKENDKEYRTIVQRSEDIRSGRPENDPDKVKHYYLNKVLWRNDNHLIPAFGINHFTVKRWEVSTDPPDKTGWFRILVDRNYLTSNAEMIQVAGGFVCGLRLSSNSCIHVLSDGGSIQKTGSNTPLGLAVNQHPIEYVEFPGVFAGADSEQDSEYVWYRSDRFHDSHYIPAPIFDLIKGPRSPYIGSRETRVFKSKQEAMIALSDAVLKWARL